MTVAPKCGLIGGGPSFLNRGVAAPKLVVPVRSDLVFILEPPRFIGVRAHGLNCTSLSRFGFRLAELSNH